MTTPAPKFETLVEGFNSFRLQAFTEFLPVQQEKLAKLGFMAGAQVTIALIQEGLDKAMKEANSDEEIANAGQKLIGNLFAEASAQLMLLSQVKT